MHYMDEWWLKFVECRFGVILHFVYESAAVVYPPYPDALAGVACLCLLPNVMLFHASCAVSHGLFS
jgi:hypothetical protein